MAAGDTLLDVFREIISTPFPGSFKERTEQQYDLLMKELKDHGSEIETPQPLAASERETIVFETLKAVYGDTRHKEEIRLIAAAALATMNRLPHSYQGIGDEFAVTRACPHLHARRFEGRTGIRPRRAKDDDARAISKQNAARPRGQSPKVHRGSNVFAGFPGLS